MLRREELARRTAFVFAVFMTSALNRAVVAQVSEGPSGYWSPAAKSESVASPAPQALTAPHASVRSFAPKASIGSPRPSEVSRQSGAAVAQLPRYTPVVERPMLAVDVDETLSITDYNSLLWGIGKDESRPLPGAQATLSRLAVSFDIVYVTARSRSLQDETRAWLSKHGFPNGDLVTSPTVGDFIFQGDFKRKAIEKLRRLHPNLIVGIGDKAKDGQAYRAGGMVSVIVNPWRNQKYHADDIVFADWSAVSSFFEANHELLSNPRLLNEALSRGRLSLNTSSEARKYQGQS